MSVIEQLIPNVAKFLNIQPSTALLLAMLISGVGNITGRLIPDDKKGFLGGVRDVAKILGLYVANRVTAGVTTTDVSRVVLGKAESWVDEKVKDVAGEPGALIPDVVEEVLHKDTPVVQAFPNFKRGPDGRFVSAKTSESEDEG